MSLPGKIYSVPTSRTHEQKTENTHGGGVGVFGAIIAMHYITGATAIRGMCISASHHLRMVSSIE
jgi:hypothetical protein